MTILRTNKVALNCWSVVPPKVAGQAGSVARLLGAFATECRFDRATVSRQHRELRPSPTWGRQWMFFQSSS